MNRRIVALGEGMIEERISGRDSILTSFGGDTLNTAIHLARMELKVRYASAIGTDLSSENLCSAWAAQGLDCSLVLRHPTRATGRYRISLDPAGERSFTYDRSNSAAREMFSLPPQDDWRSAIANTDLLIFSLISLAILSDADRRALLALAADIKKRGGKVAFDSNYRSALWESAEHARNWRDEAIALADIGLPTLDDEIALSGDQDPDETAAFWTALGCKEVVVKLGAEGCRLADGRRLAPPSRLAPLDTSGAGDAFGAAYLAARLQGAEPEPAAQAGHALASWTIMRPGAVPSRDEMAPYRPVGGTAPAGNPAKSEAGS